MKKILVILILFVCVFPIISFAGDDIYKAYVDRIISTETSQLEGFEINITNQTITVTFLEGPQKDRQATFSQNKFEVKQGETIFVQNLGNNSYQILEKNRMTMIWFVLILFIVFVLLLNGRQGIRSLLGLLLSFILILFVLLPLVLKGFNPLIVSIIIGGAILSSVLFLSHGFNRGSVIALIGTISAIIFAGLLSLFVSWWMNLTGLGNDEASSAMIATEGIVNFAELLLAGIIIGMLGVLDDIAITQVAVVGEIKKANPNLSISQLFVRGLRVGKEHVSALVNTLVLAYVGASFPLLILLYKSGIRIDMLLSQEVVAAEIVRILVGSIGLIIAVPTTTFLAARYLKKEDTVESHCAHIHH
jgi:uncharacterized membrane protein